MIRVEGKNGIYVELVADSVTSYGDRLRTFRWHYPRMVHAEVMTHRMFSRNASSSRAIPVKTILDQVINNPAMPVKFGKNKSGMQDDGELDIPIEVQMKNNVVKFDIEEFWKMASESASSFAESISNAGYHKQIANRLIEPFTYINAIVSMTDIDNFFHLRLHKDADPTFIELAKCCYEACEQSSPEEITGSDYHLPFIDKEIIPATNIRKKTIKYLADGIVVDLETAIKISISMCCQVSYRRADFSIEKAIKIWGMLVQMNPVHASPLEHIAKPFNHNEYEIRSNIQKQIEDAGLLGVNAMYCGNFRGWIQYRKTVPNENIDVFKGW